MVHVGVDLHKRVSQVAMLTAEGELQQHRLTNESGQVQRFFEQIPAPARVAIEASGTWWWLVDLLEGLGHQPVRSRTPSSPRIRQFWKWTPEAYLAMPTYADMKGKWAR